MIKKLVAFIFILGCVCIQTQAQDTTYYNAFNEKVDKSEDYEHFTVATSSNIEKKAILVTTYFKLGTKKSERTYNPYRPGGKSVKIGEETEWYESGKVKLVGHYKKGKLQGELKSYWENGQLKRHDVYDADSLISGKTWNANGEDTTYFPLFVQASSDKWTPYLIANFKYPNKARENEIVGRVELLFVVEADGTISNVRIAKSAHPILDSASVELVKSFPYLWTPGINDGEIARSFMKVPFNFTLK